MPNVLFVIDSLGLGGTERQLTLLVKYFPISWRVRVVAFGGGQFAKKIADSRIKLTVLNRRNRYDLKPVWEFGKLLLTIRPDIVHSWSWMSSAVAAPMCKLLKIKFINGCIRNSSGPDRKISGKTLRARMAFYLSNRIVANSHAGLHACGIYSAKGKVIYNGIDPQQLNRLHAGNREMTPPYTVIMTARMEPVKKFSMFIEGAREINHIDPGNWRFIALGDGKDKKELVENSSDLISNGIIEFPGAVDDVVPYLLQADIGVLLTNGKVHKEGFSNSIMEYMACGLPVICMKNGGNNELVVSNKTGFLLESDNLNNFVDKLVWLVNHPDQAIKMGGAGRERIEQLCSTERMVEEYVDLYQDVLNEKTATT